MIDDNYVPPTLEQYEAAKKQIVEITQDPTWITHQRETVYDLLEIIEDYEEDRQDEEMVEQLKNDPELQKLLEQL